MDSSKTKGRRITVGKVLLFILGCIIVLFALIVGVLGATAGFVAALIPWSASIGVFALALLVGLGLTFCLAWLGVKAMSFRRAARVALSIGVVAMLLLSVTASLSILRPISASPVPPPAPPGTRYWNLSTGSHIAYIKTPAQGKASATPIIIVGGGPGIASLNDTARMQFFARFAQFGYDVYAYDQIGAGVSARLDDPDRYTVARHVADLEAIRQQIDAQQVILIGESWGGELTANYMAIHPTHVARVVFTSPAPINPSEWSDKGGSVKPEVQDAMSLTEAPPRFLFWYILGQINGRAAHHFAPDREMDGFFDEQFQHFAPAGVCDPAHLHLPSGGLRGNGFYSNIFTNKDANTKHTQNPRQLLSINQTPALILVGSCNYIKWEVEYQYKQTLPNSTLLYIPHAGHVIYLDQPDIYFASIRAFLLNIPLPLQPWTSSTPPPPDK
jgi:proline iminopeptidase